MGQPITATEERYRRRDEAGLVRCKPRKIAYPCAAYAETKQNERQDAAG